MPRSGPHNGCVVNPETGAPVLVNEERLLASDFKESKISDLIDERTGHPCRIHFVPLWQAAREKIQREAPIDFIGLYMHGFFQYALYAYIHQLAGYTPPCTALATLF